MKRTAVVTESVGDVTTLVGPVSNRDSPGCRVRGSTLNISGDLVAPEPPDRDLSLIPEHSGDTTASDIKRTTSTSLEIVDGTTGVVPVRAHALETEGVSEETLWLRAVLVLVPSGDVRV